MEDIMLQVKSAGDALALLGEEIKPLHKKPLVQPLTEALGQIAAADVLCGEMIPPFDRSTVDGYALRARDSFGAGEGLPARLKLKGRVAMGARADFSLSPGEAAYVPTGGCLPAGADAMVMLEYSEDVGDGYVYLYKAAAPGNHLIFAGDDAKPGDVLVQRYQRLKPHHVGLLAAAGIIALPVLPPVRVGIISSGDELVDIGAELEDGQIRDVNSYLIAALLEEAGAEARRYGIAADDAQGLLHLSVSALAECDMLLLSGGSSVGQQDYSQWVLENLPASRLLLHGLAVKPGKPTLLALADGKPVFGLPGHPLSAYFICRIFVLRTLGLLQGQTQEPPRSINATLTQNYPSNSGREEYLPLALSQGPEGWLAKPIFSKSGLISLLKQAAGYTRIGREAEGLARGEIIVVELF
jgi:molybdopterin molybdotransferase